MYVLYVRKHVHTILSEDVPLVCMPGPTSKTSRLTDYSVASWRHLSVHVRTYDMCSPFRRCAAAVDASGAEKSLFRGKPYRGVIGGSVSFFEGKGGWGWAITMVGFCYRRRRVPSSRGGGVEP